MTFVKDSGFLNVVVFPLEDVQMKDVNVGFRATFVLVISQWRAALDVQLNGSV